MSSCIECGGRGTSESPCFCDESCERCEILEQKLSVVRAALVNLVNECSNGRNLGKSWSEYQIDDSVIAEARIAAERLEGGM